MKSEYCGYCFFNNVALAAEKALSSGLANRILIVDWDVHHGQATQQMFYNDPRYTSFFFYFVLLLKHRSPFVPRELINYF